MNETWAPTLSRLLDDDEVDLETLAAALETGEGRQLLVKFAGLRNAVRRDDAAPGAAFAERIEAELLRQETASQSRVARAFRPAGVVCKRWRYELVAVLAAGVLLGLAADAWLDRAADSPPAASRVLRFEAGEWTSTQGGGR